MRNYLKKGLILVGHGSREEGFNSAMKKVAAALRKEEKFDFVLCAYNEITSPSFPEAVEILVKKGAEKITVLPYFLQAGRHVRRDIPKAIIDLKEKYFNKVKFILCDYLGYDNRIVGVVKDRLQK